MSDDFDPHALDDEIAHLDRGGDVAGWVRDEPTELQPVRMSDRVHFLPEKNDYGISNRTKVGAADMAVILWIDDKKAERPVVLAIESGPMSLHQSMTPDMARRIGLALIAAADEAKGWTS